ncbi:hypothetical protein DFH06DRAFT_1180096 [Mycena polygramma]|nr:hypothetical protein DFH06DRAFT_1180096 [Mycena polygramma]
MACPNGCSAFHSDAPPSQTPGRLSSTIQHLLNSNHSPEEAETPVLAGLATEGRRRVDGLNAQIEGLKVSMGRLIAERDAWAERVQQYDAVLSPLRRVPPELIGEVFSWTLPCIRRVHGTTVDAAPWYLGQISRAWREIALSFPSLWTVITIHSLDKTPPLALQTQLARSANAPLDINFTWLTKKTVAAAPCVDVLLPHSHRWESLHLECGGRTYPSLLELLRPVRGRLDNLHTLEMCLSGGFVYEGASDIFSIAPRLRKIFLTNSMFHHLSPALLIPWNQITHYRGVVHLKPLLDILQAASNLFECTVWILNSSDKTVDDLVTLPHLRRLFTNRLELLSNVTAPELQQLSYGQAESILPVVHRSCSQLSTLVLAQSPPEDIISLLRTTRSLKHLVLRATRLDGDKDLVLDAMTRTGSSDDLCPNLTHLAYVDADYLSNFVSDVFLTMIRSRLPPDSGRQLRWLRVVSARSNARSDGVDLIQILRDQGLDAALLDNIPAFMAKASYSLTIA